MHSDFVMISFLVLVIVLTAYNLYTKRYSNSTYREGPIVASGFIWSVGFVILFILNFYWDSLLTVLS